MKTISKASAICAVAAVLAVSGAAWADGYRHHRHGEGYTGSYAILGYGIKQLSHHAHRLHHYKDRHRGKHHYKRHDRGRKRHYRRSGHRYGGYGHGHGRKGYGKRGYAKHGYDCHPVSQVKWHHGRKARFGGTLCYDRYGNGYIVPGSRYFVGYLY